MTILCFAIRLSLGKVSPDCPQYANIAAEFGFPTCRCQHSPAVSSRCCGQEQKGCNPNNRQYQYNGYLQLAKQVSRHGLKPCFRQSILDFFEIGHSSIFELAQLYSLFFFNMNPEAFPWKFLTTQQFPEGQLFDLHEDPGESQDVGDQYPELRRFLAAGLKQWRARQLSYYYHSKYYRNFYPPRPPSVQEICDAAHFEFSGIGQPLAGTEPASR